jgi:hypothetical protein
MTATQWDQVLDILTHHEARCPGCDLCDGLSATIDRLAHQVQA